MSRKTLRRTVFAAAIAVTTVVAGSASVAWAGSASDNHHGRVFNVRDYGAVGDGVANDAPAVDAAITAANASGRGTVEFPPGTYLAGGTIHLRSHVTLQVDKGATVVGGKTGYDAPEPNPNDAFQDFGHSHFHDAMIFGDSLTDIGFVGGGVIDGGGNLQAQVDPVAGQADKILSLTRCTGLTLGNGLTLRRGGHFAALVNDCDGVYSDHLTIDTATDRDGWDVISTRHAVITNITVSSNDDALAFKSDWALGQTLPNGDVYVDHAHLSAVCCNALMFGSETCGDFDNYVFDNITITGAGKSGLGMTTNDGAHISNVFYNNVTMSNTDSPIFEKVGTRLRCGTHPPIGGISGIHYTNVTGTSAGAFTPTLWGQPGHLITDVTFTNVHLALPGGHRAGDPNLVPTDTLDYNPRSLGVRPSYGFYLHNATGIRFVNTSLSPAADDGRPAIIANTANNVTLDNVTVAKGTTSPFDLGFQAVGGFCLRNTALTGGARPRISTTGTTTTSCPSRLDNVSVDIAPTGTVTAGSSTTYTLRTKATAGHPGPVQLAVSGLRRGMTATFNPATVVPGHDATLTVSTTAEARNGTDPLTIVGTSAFATAYASTNLTVSGGVDVAVTGLTVADAGAWSVASNLHVGSIVNGDRTAAFVGVPAAMQGVPYVQTANASVTSTANPLVSFTLNVPASVVVGVDTRTTKRPWMDASWVDSGLQLVDQEGTTYRYFELYVKDFAAGPVSLGPDADPVAGDSMYTIAVL
jgi:polygalacturonase